jgi:hypothetical protein
MVLRRQQLSQRQQQQQAASSAAQPSTILWMGHPQQPWWQQQQQQLTRAPGSVMLCSVLLVCCLCAASYGGVAHWVMGNSLGGKSAEALPTALSNIPGIVAVSACGGRFEVDGQELPLLPAPLEAVAASQTTRIPLQAHLLPAKAPARLAHILPGQNPGTPGSGRPCSCVNMLPAQ